MNFPIRERLIADAAVFAVVGSRVYLDNLAQECTTPSISILLVSDAPQPMLSGQEAATNEQWQVDCWAPVYADAHALAGNVTTAMQGNGNGFTSVRTGRSVAHETDTGLYRVTLEFSLWL